MELKQLEEDDVNNLDEKEHIIFMDYDISTIIKQKEEDEAQKLMEK